jgi:hypothetical protein
VELELVFASALVVLLLAVGGFYAWRQVALLRKLGTSTEAPQERGFLRTLAIRRLVCSGLILVFAGLLCGSYFLEGIVPHEKPTDEDERALYTFSVYWIGTFLVFLTILCLAALDVLATRRFTLRQLRHLHEQHDEMLAQQAARVRGRRNGSV